MKTSLYISSLVLVAFVFTFANVSADELWFKNNTGTVIKAIPNGGHCMKTMPAALVLPTVGERVASFNPGNCGDRIFYMKFVSIASGQWLDIEFRKHGDDEINPPPWTAARSASHSDVAFCFRQGVNRARLILYDPVHRSGSGC